MPSPAVFVPYLLRWGCSLSAVLKCLTKLLALLSPLLYLLLETFVALKLAHQRHHHHHQIMERMMWYDFKTPFGNLLSWMTMFHQSHTARTPVLMHIVVPYQTHLVCQHLPWCLTVAGDLCAGTFALMSSELSYRVCWLPISLKSRVFQLYLHITSIYLFFVP